MIVIKIHRQKERTRHAFEAGRRGKPDELEGIMAGRMGACLLEMDPRCRFDLRVAGSWRGGRPAVRVSGEASSNVLERPGVGEGLASEVLRTYNSVHMESRKPGDLLVETCLKPQAPVLGANCEAGDSGNPIAVAYAKGPNFLPWERYLAVRIRDLIDWVFANCGSIPRYLSDNGGNDCYLRGLRADGKVSVEADYLGAELAGISSIVIAAQHGPLLSIGELREKLEALVRRDLAQVSKESGRNLGTPHITINGNGAWNVGGWAVDEGNREAKPYRDGFGSYGVCEDSFSGEDPTKPSGTGTLLARSIAVDVVGGGLAEFARVCLSYRIGLPEVGLNIATGGTSSVPQDELERIVREGARLGIRDAIERFGLRDPETHRRIAEAADYFQNPDFAWNCARKLCAAGIRTD